MTERALLLLHPAFNTSTLAAAIDGFFVANWLSGQTLYQWQIASYTGGEVGGFGGFPVVTEALARLSPRECDIVLAFSSFDPFGLADAPGVAGFLREAHRFGARIGGLETGGVAMAKAGLLDGKEAALHWANREGFAERFPRVTLNEAPVHRDGRCLTCAGGAAALDLILMLIEEDAGQSLAQGVAAHLLRPWGGGGRATAPNLNIVRGRDDLVQAAQAFMATHISEPIPLSDLALRLGTSLRSLERRFSGVIGQSPRDYYLALRLTRAQNLLQQTSLPVGEIAAETGFESPQAFSRAYRTRFQRPPSQDRQQIETASVPTVL